MNAVIAESTMPILSDYYSELQELVPHDRSVETMTE